MKTPRLFRILSVLFFCTPSFAADLQPPLLASVTLSTTNIDVSVSNQTIVVSAVLTDDLSGLTSASFTFLSPSQNQQATVNLTPNNISTGTVLNGNYTNRLVLPRYAEGGVWSIQSVELRDATSNIRTLDYGSLLRMGILPQFNVTGIADILPPQFQSLNFTPTTVDVDSSNRVVNFTIHVTDDLSGISYSPFEGPIISTIGLTFRSPSGRQYLGVSFAGMNRMSGDNETASTPISLFCLNSAKAVFGFWISLTLQMPQATARILCSASRLFLPTSHSF